jgi:hypothetical protein
MEGKYIPYNLSGRYRDVSQRMTFIKEEERKLVMKEVCCQ